MQILVHNISEAGLVIESDLPFAVGDALDISLPHSGVAKARVAWVSNRLAGCDFDLPVSRVSLGAARLLDAVSAGSESDEPIRQGESFGMRIQRLRVSRGMSQAQLAKLMGVSHPAVCAWELNRARPRAGRMEALARILGVSVSDLLGHQEVISLPAEVARARREIARAAGVSESQVKIYIAL